MHIQWYPGHMTKTKRMIVSQMSLIDVVIELLDARIPISSRNPDIDELCKHKKRVVALNKSDLADPNITKQWQKHFESQGLMTLVVNAKDTDKKRGGLTHLAASIREQMAEKTQALAKRGRIGKSIRCMIVGIPNVGKSTFINQFSGRASTLVADRPGVTRGRQWIRIDGGFELLDTPGVLWPKFEDQQVGIKLAVTGAVSDNVVDSITLADEFIKMMLEIKPSLLENRYKIETGEKAPREILEIIGAARGFLLKGGIIDIERAAIILIDEYRAGKLGRISLEKPLFI